MKFTPADFPLIAQGDRIYTQQRADGQVLQAIDEEMARDVVDRLNRANEVVLIPRLALDVPPE